MLLGGPAELAIRLCTGMLAITTLDAGSIAAIPNPRLER